ncbi:MAG: 50S ribosomal protein L3 [Nitrospirales bacterium]|nr:50S ribosomal protein L3 [Nitrospirales bacterium]
MIQGLVGKKLGMLEVYDEDRTLTPVTMIEAGPCGVVQVKTNETDGYSRVQIGFQSTSKGKLCKPELGHLKKAGEEYWRHLAEFSSKGSLEPGQQIKADIFSKGDSVSVQAISKGKGFQGVIKRHHFAGGPASHGSMFHRAPGSLGQSSFPSRVFKNKKLPGHMGHRRITVKGLSIVDVRVEENILLVSGSVPGPVGGMVVIKKVE